MKIIINADDLGLSAAVNDAIFALMEEGRITSATLMANAPAAEEAARRLGELPGCSFGVHLVSTELRPLSSHPGLAPVLNERGEFAGNLRRIKITPAIADGIFTEWCAQIDRALALGVPISHIDSHHHSHTEPRLFPVVKRIQKKYGIRKVRQSRTLYDCGKEPPAQLRVAKRIWNFALRHYVPTTTTKGFTSFETFHRLAAAGYHLPDTLELMCHPGGELFAHETALLRTSWKQELAPEAQ
ncbi:MAG: ChbG/HpnK family deacetylase, partial [Terracidiphilus sp.]